MLRAGIKHDYPEETWDAAKEEARSIMIERAKRGDPIYYSKLTAAIGSIRFDPQDQLLFHFLGEISTEEDEAGRGLLTAVVVHKADGRPGDGFFDLARSRGRDVSNKDRCWIDELKKVGAYWQQNRPDQPFWTGEFEQLPVTIPEWSGDSHPFSRGMTPRFYRPDELKDSAEGDTPRTRFFEKILVGIYWAIGRPVPYAFITKGGDVRSLDAGCVKFLRNRIPSRIDFVVRHDGIIVAVVPSVALVSSYEPLQSKLLAEIGPGADLLGLPFDLDAPVDERQKMESERVIREGADAFRKQVLAAWKNRCAITRTNIDAVLDAAHIFPYLGANTNDPRNGLALRADIHRLFDRYLLTISEDSKGATIKVAQGLRSSRYGKLDGSRIVFPSSAAERPDRRILEWHGKHFAGTERGSNGGK